MSEVVPHEEVSLLDLLDRVLDKGVVIRGHLTLGVADIALVEVDLRIVLGSSDSLSRIDFVEAPQMRTPPKKAQKRQPKRRSKGEADVGTKLKEIELKLDEYKVGDSDPGRDLVKLVLTLVDLLRQLMERRAIRRMENGSLTDEQMERLGVAFMRMEETLQELKAQFSLKDEDLNLDLGPFGKLM